MGLTDARSGSASCSSPVTSTSSTSIRCCSTAKPIWCDAVASNETWLPYPRKEWPDCVWNSPKSPPPLLQSPLTLTAHLRYTPSSRPQTPASPSPESSPESRENRRLRRAVEEMERLRLHHKRTETIDLISDL